MKKYVALVTAILLILSFSTISFAASDVNADRPVFHDSIVITDTDSYDAFTRGTSAPTTDFDLSNADYSGTVYFDSSVYTNRRFTNHDGSITVDTDFESDSSYSGAYVTVNLCLKALIGDNIVASKRVDLNNEDSVVFTGLNTSKKYYIQFTQPGSQVACPVSGSFTISR